VLSAFPTRESTERYQYCAFNPPQEFPSLQTSSTGKPLRQWWKLSTDLALAGFEAQRVIALRLMKLAAGGPAADQEARRMVTEKIAASAEAAATLATGGSPQAVLHRYRTIMRANQRRLSRRNR
jgi:hypothetical protein